MRHRLQVNHGVAPGLGAAAYSKSAAFHDLPDDVKRRTKYYIPHGNENVSQLIGARELSAGSQIFCSSV